MRATNLATRREALTLLAASIAWAVLLAPMQTDRTAGAHARYAQRGYVSPFVATHAISPSAGAQRGSDVVLEAYPLSIVRLSSLQRDDRIDLPHPDGGTIRLRVTRSESNGGARHLALIHDGLVSTFTLARGTFFGTLATPRGVYALEGDAHGSRLTRHALLDQRTNTHALDYRPSPAG